MADEVVAVEAAAPALGEPMDLMTALQLVLKKSLAHDDLVRGLHEGAKAIEKHVAQLCVLAESCDQPDYVKLVRALCADHNVHLVTMPNAKTLGEWAGLCKIDSEGKARKVVGCACVVVKDYGEESEGLHIVQEYVKSQLSLREWHRWACPHGPPVNMTPPSPPLLLPQLRRRDSG